MIWLLMVSADVSPGKGMQTEDSRFLNENVTSRAISDPINGITHLFA